MSADENKVSEMCGIPNLSTATKLTLHTWHKNNNVPPLDVFNLWVARAQFTNLIMPPSIDAMCRYGAPFMGGSNPIVGYEAGIGTTPNSPDVVEFKEVRYIAKPVIISYHVEISLDKRNT